MLKSFEGGTGCLPAVMVRVGGENCALLHPLFPVSSSPTSHSCKSFSLIFSFEKFKFIFFYCLL